MKLQKFKNSKNKINANKRSQKNLMSGQDTNALVKILSTASKITWFNKNCHYGYHRGFVPRCIIRSTL